MTDQKTRLSVYLLVLLALVCAVPLASAGGATAPKAAAQVAKVDINQAGVAELETLPRIGPALARRIIAYRKEHGPFRDVDSLLAVKGIGPRLLTKLRPRIVAGSASKKAH